MSRRRLRTPLSGSLKHVRGDDRRELRPRSARSRGAWPPVRSDRGGACRRTRRRQTTSPAGPVFAIVPVWDAIAPASEAVASGDVRRFVVHYEQDMLLHRPLEAGMRVVSRATPVAVLPRPNGTSLVIKTETRDEDGELVNEQYVTEFFRGVQADEGVGERAPDHRLEADGDPVAEVTYLVARGPDRPLRGCFRRRLRDPPRRRVRARGSVSRDASCTASARWRSRAGPFSRRRAVDDPRAVRRLAVRFSAPLFPGESLTTRVWDARRRVRLRVGQRAGHGRPQGRPPRAPVALAGEEWRIRGRRVGLAAVLLSEPDGVRP